MTRYVILSLLFVFVFACNTFEPEFSTPQYTLKTYVYAYNKGNGNLLRKCGMATQLDKAFTKSVEDQNGKEVVIPVENIQFKLKDINEGDMNISKYSAIRRVWIDVEFTSISDPDYYFRKTILFEEKRLPFESKIFWQIP
jgi:hypothetical protein